MYFTDFPKFLYEFNIKNKLTGIIVKDITRNIRFRRDILSNVLVYDEYDIVDGETPEHIAEKVYGNPQYHWIIMLSNDRYDYIKDFPLTYDVLEKYVFDKYGVDKYATHHYVNSIGSIVDSTVFGATAVTNWDYEESLNESKRRINIIPKSSIELILKNFKALI